MILVCHGIKVLLLNIPSTGKMNVNTRKHLVRRKWIPGVIDHSTLSPAGLAREISNRYIFYNSGFNEGIIASTGFKMHQPLPDCHEIDCMLELIKVMIFDQSDQQLFPKSVRLSKTRLQIFLDIVQSDHDRTRNYFARRTADLAKISKEVVQTATSLSVAFNTGALQIDSVWYIPPITELKEDDIPLLQLLTMIFTHEKVFPSIEDNRRVKLIPFPIFTSTLFCARLYEYYLLQGHIINGQDL